ARAIVTYLEREMRSPEGLFHATQDADTEGEEGRFFVWTRAELDQVLGAELGRVAALRWGVEDEGNFEGGPSSVLSIGSTAEAIAKELGLGAEDVIAKIDEARTKLFAARGRRAKPFRDEKVIASWNGLAIGALAAAGTALGEPKMIAMA